MVRQCTQAVKNELEARKDWKLIEDNPIKTLKATRETSHNCQSTKHCIGTVSKSIRDFFIAQEDGKKPVEFVKHHETNKDILELRFGKSNMPQRTPKSVKVHWTRAARAIIGEDEVQQLLDSTHNSLIGNNHPPASGLDNSRKLNEELANNCAKGNDKCPKDLDHAIEMLNNYRAPVPCDKNKIENN